MSAGFTSRSRPQACTAARPSAACATTRTAPARLRGRPAVGPVEIQTRDVFDDQEDLIPKPLRPKAVRYMRAGAEPELQPSIKACSVPTLSEPTWYRFKTM